MNRSDSKTKVLRITSKEPIDVDPSKASSTDIGSSTGDIVKPPATMGSRTASQSSVHTKRKIDVKAEYEKRSKTEKPALSLVVVGRAY